MNTDDFEFGFVSGLLAGTAIVVFMWIMVALWTEQAKVNTGFLTYENKTYTVSLYDTLEEPNKPEK